jgi:hypothetical protein
MASAKCESPSSVAATERLVPTINPPVAAAAATIHCLRLERIAAAGGSLIVPIEPPVQHVLKLVCASAQCLHGNISAKYVQHNVIFFAPDA